MANKVLETFNGLPGWAKGFLSVGTLLIISGVGYTIYKNKQNAIKSAADNEKLIVTKKEADALRNSGMKDSYDETGYNAMADTLFAAMDGYGTDAPKIYSVMSQMKNDLDIHDLIDAYGMRTLSSGTWNPVKDVSRSLAGALGDELGTEYGGSNVTGNDIANNCWGKLKSWQMAQQKDIVNCILKTNGLTFQF